MCYGSIGEFVEYTLSFLRQNRCANCIKTERKPRRLHKILAFHVATFGHSIALSFSLALYLSISLPFSSILNIYYYRCNTLAVNFRICLNFANGNVIVKMDQNFVLRMVLTFAVNRWYEMKETAHYFLFSSLFCFRPFLLQT